MNNTVTYKQSGNHVRMVYSHPVQRHGWYWTVEQGCRVPWWLGAFRFYPPGNRYEYFPIVLNVPARMLWLLFLWIYIPVRESRLEDRYRELEKEPLSSAVRDVRIDRVIARAYALAESAGSRGLESRLKQLYKHNAMERLATLEEVGLISMTDKFSYCKHVLDLCDGKAARS